MIILKRPRIHLFLLLAMLVGSMWSARAPSVVTGRVIASDAGTPIMDAQVGVKGSRHRVASDQAGRFRLPLLRVTTKQITAWKAGFYIGGAEARGNGDVTIPLQPHPQVDAQGYEWLDPNPDPAGTENCANCHAEIFRQWSASSHARSAVNRHFLDVFDGTDWSGRQDVGWNFARDLPEARAVCSACHLPTVSADDPVAEDPSRAAGVTREGIHCDFCHKIADSDLAHEPQFVGLQHGRDALRLVRPGDGRQIFFGPLDDVDRGRDTFSPLYRSSVYCASCHEGTLFGTRVYETFSEWQASSYARRGVECQHCHMKPDGVMRNFAPGHGGIERDAATLAAHHFPGATDEAFLRSAAELKLTARVHDGLLHVDVVVRPVNVGHRLPTGTPERHLLLVVRATSDRGDELPLHEGPTIPAAGGVGPREARNYAGLPGKLYGKLLEGPGGVSPAPFWRASTTQFDTRLAPDEQDHSRFTFETTQSSTRRVRVQATLLYRRFYKMLLDEKGWPDRDVVLATHEIECRRE